MSQTEHKGIIELKAQPGDDRPDTTSGQVFHGDTAVNFLDRVLQETVSAYAKHPPLHSPHEAYAVILEELDEFKAEVWKQSNARDPQAMYTELVQIAAMCLRTAHDCLQHGPVSSPQSARMPTRTRNPR